MVTNATLGCGTLLIWDAEETPPKGYRHTVLWRSFAEGIDPEVISVPQFVEEHAASLRDHYLAWIYDLGETRIKGKRLVDHLELRPQFSYWWMTLLVEKSYGKSKRLYDAFRFLALEDLNRSLQASRIILASGDKTIAVVFQLWCQNAGMIFEWRRTTDRKESFVRRLYHVLPYPIQTAISLSLHLWQRLPLRKKNTALNEAPGAEITFVDYLIHLDRSALLTGRFASNYWTDLLSILDRAGSKVNWLHLFVQHEAVASTKKARDLIARFNENGRGQQFHFCLDGTLSISVLLAALRDYVRLISRSLRLTSIRRHFRPSGSMLDLWPLYKEDWVNSMRGPTAMFNCLFLCLFERTLKKLPRQKLGVYLQENQGWEMAFMHAWRAAGHGRLIGVPHATVRYWDLRYFFDPRSYERKGKNDLPVPDQVAVNGPAALKAYRNAGYPGKQLVAVEALRYLHLLDATRLRNDTRDTSAVQHVLVCGDLLPAVSQQMMQWLESAAQRLPQKTRYTVKPHPSCAIRPADYPALQLEMTGAPLVDLLAGCDVVFASNITSAAVDAYGAGVPVVLVLDGNTFNMSPLRGLEGVVYVTSPTELAEALRQVRSRKRVVAEPYFCLDRELPRWRKLLNFSAVVDVKASP